MGLFVSVVQDLGGSSGKVPLCMRVHMKQIGAWWWLPVFSGGLD